MPAEANERNQTMILPRGITGFNIPRSALPPNQKAFVSDLWSAVAAQRGRVEDRPQVLSPRHTSFITRVVVVPNSETTVLLNAVYPWVGFCRPLTPGDCGLEFTEFGLVATSLEATGRYHVLETHELERPLTQDMLGDLGIGELAQLNYWSRLAQRGRMRVGDVVFNFWD